MCVGYIGIYHVYVSMCVCLHRCEVSYVCLYGGCFVMCILHMYRYASQVTMCTMISYVSDMYICRRIRETYVFTGAYVFTVYIFAYPPGCAFLKSEREGPLSFVLSFLTSFLLSLLPSFLCLIRR